jgi:peptidoglycan/xylan/chitin deacetylase (PgdA/CDA1 family)
LCPAYLKPTSPRSMSLIRSIRLGFLHAAERSGLNEAVLNSVWRSKQLLIICWHQVSHDDEHMWSPGLCISPRTFRARLELLRSTRCNVISLDEALDGVKSGRLPRRAVALTLDDGESSVYLHAWPMLREFGFPATLYWTTYYSVRPYAVFDPMVSYLLWKGRGRHLQMDEPPLNVRLESERERLGAFRNIYQAAKTHGWTAAAKEDFLARLSGRLDVNYDEIKKKRILHMISPEEAARMCAEGLDLQLHTHRHRVPRVASHPANELQDNAKIIEAAGARRPVHFCYPSGSYTPELEVWLRDNGVVSAATCKPGLVQRHTNPYFLPRMVDQENLKPVEFIGWLSGVFAWMTTGSAVDEHGFQ